MACVASKDGPASVASVADLKGNSAVLYHTIDAGARSLVILANMNQCGAEATAKRCATGVCGWMTFDDHLKLGLPYAHRVCCHCTFRAG
jgi:hypothetical protein